MILSFAIFTSTSNSFYFFYYWGVIFGYARFLAGDLGVRVGLYRGDDFISGDDFDSLSRFCLMRSDRFSV
jgi:hypothetical protein